MWVKDVPGFGDEPKHVVNNNKQLHLKTGTKIGTKKLKIRRQLL